MGGRVALVKWTLEDATSSEISNELTNLAYEPVQFLFSERIPDDVDIVLTFAPYGRWIQIPQQIAHMPVDRRPFFVHCNTENPPDPRIPWLAMAAMGHFRSWIDRLSNSERLVPHFLGKHLSVLWGRRPMARFRYIGDSYYAYRKGWVDLFVEFSEIYARFHCRHGLPIAFVPWGTGTGQYADLKLERDIDVLWMGVRRNKRRSDLIETMRSQLRLHGVNMLVVDGVENPLIFRDTRTRILNRTKIVVNLLTHWYENVLPYRFHMVAGNGCLVVSEPELPHSPAIVAGKHYVESRTESITESILYYLTHEKERERIVEDAYALVTRELTFNRTVSQIMAAVEQVRAIRAQREGEEHGSA